MRPPYAEYVKYAMRAYIAEEKNYDPVKVGYSTRAEQDNWLCCRRALQRLQDEERSILMKVYASYDTMPDNVYQAAKASNLEQDEVWDLIHRFEDEFAKLRGLI